MDLCEFKASLVYRGESRTTIAVTERNSVLKNKQTKGNMTLLANSIITTLWS